MADNMRLSLVLSAKDRMSSIIKSSTKKSDKAFAEFEKRLEKTSSVLSGIGKKSMLAGSAMIAATAVNLKNAADFETSMSSVSTLIDTNVESLDMMKKQVLEIGKRTPVELSQLTGALYDVRSAGILASDQFKVLEKSAQLGVAGLGTTSEAVDLVTSSINAFKLKGEEQDKLYDNIFKTIKTGKTTISGLAQGFGSVAGTVAAANIKIDDYLATVAALTTTGQPAAQAHTQMKAAIAGLTRNTKEQQKIFRALHAKDFNDLIVKSGSVVNAFSGINRQVKGNKAKLIELLGSIEAYNAVLSLTGNQNKAYTDTLYEMRNGANEFDVAYLKKLETVNAQLQRGRNIMKKISIDFGNEVAPVFQKTLNVADKLLNKFDAMPEPLKKTIAMTTLIGGVGLIGFGGLTLAAAGSINMFKDTLKAYRTLSKFMYRHRFMAEVKAIKGLSLAFRGLGVSIMSTPVGWLIAGGALLVGTGLLIHKYWKPLTAFFSGLAIGIKAGLAPTFRELKKSLEPFQPLFDLVGKGIGIVGDYIKKIISPINTAGTQSNIWGKSLGMLIGKFIGGTIQVAKFLVKLHPLVALSLAIYKNFDKISAAVSGASDKLKGFFGKFGNNKKIDISAKVTDGKPKVDGSHARGLAFVPHDGYIAELHKGERVLTAGENRERQRQTNALLSRTDIGAEGKKRQLMRGSTSGNVIYLTYAPVINAGKIQDIKGLEQMLDRREKRLMQKLRTAQRRKEARRYA